MSKFRKVPGFFRASIVCLVALLFSPFAGPAQAADDTVSIYLLQGVPGAPQDRYSGGVSRVADWSITKKVRLIGKAPRFGSTRTFVECYDTPGDHFMARPHLCAHLVTGGNAYNLWPDPTPEYTLAVWRCTNAEGTDRWEESSPVGESKKACKGAIRYGSPLGYLKP
ncbi:hypothetical protein [Streptomyces virginiae]|uniref:hypothetical protein n=1 Tax=Streptomyces virginiae TaxID=1961 RepID=UPI00131C69D5|nr:hypothetical protein [Streptomyces virginiae]